MGGASDLRRAWRHTSMPSIFGISQSIRPTTGVGRFQERGQGLDSIARLDRSAVLGFQHRAQQHPVRHKIISDENCNGHAAPTCRSHLIFRPKHHRAEENILEHRGKIAVETQCTASILLDAPAFFALGGRP